MSGRRLLACIVVIVTLSLSKGAPQPALAAPSSPPLLVATRFVLVYVNGDTRQTASAGANTGNYRLLRTLADGSVLVSFNDGGSLDVESISPSLGSRRIKSFPRGTAFIGPSTDGFVAYDGMMQLLRRYDESGSALGKPIAPPGVRDAIGMADATPP